MKESYEKPVILKLQMGLMNKFGASYLKRTRTEIDGVPVNKLIEEFGSPLFVFSEKRLRRKYKEIYNAFATRYPNVQFSWSYKTNYLNAICAILHQEGEIAEVVSEFEYEKARRLGIEGRDIIFNGPYKPSHILEKAIREQAIINIDHFEEIYDLEEIADKLGQKVKVGIRLNMDTGITPQWSRFGFNLETGQALDAVKRIAYSKKLILNGLHCHIGTFILEPRAYAQEVEKMVKFAYQIEDEFGFKIEYLDIGGGFPSQNRLKGIYLPPELAVPSIEEFAEAICDTLLRSLRPNDFPELILETGRVIVDEAGYLISTVHAAKRLPDGTKAYVIDAGVNLLFTSFWYKFNIELDREVQGVFEPCVIYGPLCMNIDVIDEHTQLPPLPRGTRLIISPVGAYNVTQWMQFISYRPSVVLINSEGKIEVIREAETLEDVVRKEKLPARLKLVQ
ncbi:MAG: alanine racemase [Candidatus Desulfofervidaceae bacterium]|nr:alanine racemase [Candidatus Desulfofervidaceae bacterium]